MKESILITRIGEGTGVVSTSAGFSNLLSAIFTLAMTAGGIFMLFQMILGAVNWINSQGDKEKLTKAQKQITNALIGFVILFGVWVLFITLTTQIFPIFEKTGDGLKLNLPSLFGD
jgi:hypothetical protein